MNKTEAEIFGFLFLGDGAIISRCPLLNILASSKNITFDVLGAVDCQGYLDDGKREYSFVINF